MAIQDVAATVGPLQGVGPETAREMKLKTVTSVWECVHAAHLRRPTPSREHERRTGKSAR